MQFMTKGRTPKSKWYDGHCLADKLKIYAVRAAIIVAAYGVGTIHKELSGPVEYIEEPEEMNCTRAGWGGDC